MNSHEHESQAQAPPPRKHNDRHRYTCNHWHEWVSSAEPSVPRWEDWPLPHRHPYGERERILTDHARAIDCLSPPEV